MTNTPPMILTNDAIIKAALSWLSRKNSPNRRLILGIAGIAGSGKSTLAQRFVDALNEAAPASAVMIPMDGFHLPNSDLEARGWKLRKGAHFTYNADAYVELLNHYRSRSAIGSYPIYCRKVHEPVTSPEAVTQSTQVIVTEGQYLLRPDKPWVALADVLDECWWLDVTIEKARRWLMKRDTSVGRSAEEAKAKYLRNDQLNTHYVLAERRNSDRIVSWPEPT